MTQHTPGPWSLEHLGGELHLVAGFNPKVPVVNLDAGDVSPADARLIAKAPEMLEALRACAEALASPIITERTEAEKTARALLRELEEKL